MKLGIDWPESWTEWTSSWGQKERRQLYLAFKDEISDLRALSLRDRDDEPAERVGADLVDNRVATVPEFHPRRWRRRYIESYLIWPPAIAAAAGMTEEQVRQHLTDHHGISVGANFTDSDAPQGLLDVRGKQILKAVGSSAILGQFDVSALEVAREMDAEAIPEDIKTFLNDVVALA